MLLVFVIISVATPQNAHVRATLEDSCMYTLCVSKYTLLNIVLVRGYMYFTIRASAARISNDGGSAAQVGPDAEAHGTAQR